MTLTKLCRNIVEFFYFRYYFYPKNKPTSTTGFCFSCSLTSFKPDIMKLFVSLASALTIAPAVVAGDGRSFRPVVIWHGMGDRYDSPSMERAIGTIQQVHKGIQVYPIRLSDDGSTDSQSTILGYVNDQVYFLLLATETVRELTKCIGRLTKYANNSAKLKASRMDLMALDFLREDCS